MITGYLGELDIPRVPKLDAEITFSFPYLCAISAALLSTPLKLP